MESQHKKDCFWYSDGQGALLPGGDTWECSGVSNLQDINQPNTKPIMMTINPAFTIGQIVYLKTDPDQYMRIVTGLQITGDNNILYKLAVNMSEQWHYAMEISDTRDITSFTED